MAKVKFSALISEMRNKLNGSVFSKNRAGNFLRNKVTPTNPQTFAQMQVRAVFGFVSQAWKGLTADQVAGWNSLASTVPYTDIFGDTKYLSGLQFHQKLNTNLSTVNEGIISDPPTLVEVPASLITGVIATNTAGVLSLVMNVNGASSVPAGMSLVVSATPPLGVGISYVKSMYRQITVVVAPGTTNNLGAEYTARFGVPPAGSKIFVRAHYVDNTTGQNSVATNFSTIVIAG